MPNAGSRSKRAKIITAPSDTDDLPVEETSARDELASIVSSLSAYLEWQSVVGATGIPRDPDLKERLQRNPLPEWGQPVRSTPLAGQPSLARGTTSTQRAPAHRPASTISADPQDQSARSASTEPSLPTAADPPPLPPSVQEPRKPPRPLPLIPDFEALQEKVASCTRCDLHKERTQTVFSRGSPKSRLVFVGEGPGQEEDLQGSPFVGPAGQLLDKMIEAMGLSPDDIYICNIVKCRPPNNRKPTPQEMQECSPYLENQLQLLQPEVIVALGGTAVAGLLGITDGITQVRGRFRLYQKQILVMPTFHPAYLLRNPSAKRHVWSDLKQVAHHLGIEVPSRA